MIEFKVEGLKELEDQLDGLGDAIGAQRLVQSALRSAAKPMLEAAKAKAPVASEEYVRYLEKGRTKTYQPGHVGEQIVLRKHMDGSSGSEIAGLILTVKRKGWWGRFFEFGTTKQAKQPFMLPAFDEEGERVIATFSSFLRKAIARYIKRKAKTQ